MKKSFLLCTMLFAACFVNGAEYLFDTQASCEAEGKTKLGFKDGHHVLKGNCHFWTTQMFKHDPAKKYKISAEVMTESQQPYPSFIFGVVFFDDKGRFIYTKEYVTAPNGFTELAKKFRLVAAVEKHHEERYRALLHNVEMAEVFAKSEVKVWECRNCGHIAIGTKAPELCPTCAHPKSYFEIHAENY